MFRLLACIEYIGYNYIGWQKQFLNDNSIQSILEKILLKFFKYNINIICASRTDKGVNSLGQIIHFDIKEYINTKNILSFLNFFLPDTISVKWIKYISISFHARKHALYRRYIYVLCINKIKSIFLNKLVLYYNNNLSINLMSEACKYLVGRHDFSSFRSSGCESLSPYKKILYFKIFKCRNFIFFDIKANSFLYHMVRNLVSSLLLIGMKKYSVLWIKDYLYYRNKNAFLIDTVKPYGLYLVSIDYNFT